MKKFFLVLMSTFLVFSLMGNIGIAFAEENTSTQELKKDNKYFKYSQEENGEVFYTYKYKGVEISGNSLLSEEAIESMFGDILNENKVEKDTSLITPSYIPVESFPGTIYAGPYYTHYDNSEVRFAAELTVAWLAKKIPYKFTDYVLVNYTVNKFSNWASSIKDTYVGVWVTKAYNSYEGYYDYYETLVHYTDSSYSTPISVQYYVVDRG